MEKLGTDENRFEREPDEFYRRIYEKYREIAAAKGLLQPDLAAQAAHGIGVDEQVVARRRGVLGEVGEVVQHRYQPIDHGGPLERRTGPRRREIA